YGILNLDRPYKVEQGVDVHIAVIVQKGVKGAIGGGKKSVKVGPVIKNTVYAASCKIDGNIEFAELRIHPAKSLQGQGSKHIIDDMDTPGFRHNISLLYRGRTINGNLHIIARHIAMEPVILGSLRKGEYIAIGYIFGFYP